MSNYNMLNKGELSLYLKDLRKIKVMTPEREEELSEIMLNPATSDEEKKKVRNEILEGNLRIVLVMVKKYQNQGLSTPDLVSEGNIGLVKAIETFDWSRKIKFISYAVWWIRQSILLALNEKSRTIRLPINIVVELEKHKKNLDELTSYDSLSQHAKMSAHAVASTVGEVDIFDMISDPDSMSPDERLMSKESLNNKLLGLLGVLTDREKKIVEDYFGLTGTNKNLEHIGEELNLTKERIRHIKEKALKKLRANSYKLFEEI